jgi:hypothetical protein
MNYAILYLHDEQPVVQVCDKKQQRLFASGACGLQMPFALLRRVECGGREIWKVVETRYFAKG